MTTRGIDLEDVSTVTSGDQLENTHLFGRSTRRNKFMNFFFGSQRNRYIWTGVCVLLILVFFIVIPLVVLHQTSTSDSEETPKNVIFMISDGCGPASYTFGRMCAAANPSMNILTRNGILPLEEHLVGTIRTHSSDSLITDSAASGTAYSCGLKTYNGAIAVDPDGKPCGTLMEAAQIKGMKTGLVVTSTISHATPASFSSHSSKRADEEFIAKQQVDHKIDVMFGGGKEFYTNRKDGTNLIDYAKQKGYMFVDTISDFAKVGSLPVIGLFAQGHLDYEIDRNPSQQPSLADMTRKALQLLSEDNSKGFFLMIEGSRIDMAGHINDAPAHLHDIIAYNEAAKVVLEFIEKNPNTMLVATSDHETGGLTMGRSLSNETYGVYEWYPEIVNRVNVSTVTIAKNILNGMTARDAMSVFAGLTLTDEENNKITQAISSGEYILGLSIADVISKRARVGWTTLAHSSVDVNLYANGFGTNYLRGNMENTDLNKFVSSKIELDLAAASREYSNFNPIAPQASRSEQLYDDPYHH